MNDTEFKKLLEKMRVDGENEDFYHEELAKYAQQAFEDLSGNYDIENITDEQQDQLIEAWFGGFCTAEGYKK